MKWERGTTVFFFFCAVMQSWTRAQGQKSCANMQVSVRADVTTLHTEAGDLSPRMLGKHAV